MKCRICGATQQPTTTDLPFKTGDRSIVISNRCPVFQCEQCSEYSMDDPTFQRVEEILARRFGSWSSRSKGRLVEEREIPFAA